MFRDTATYPLSLLCKFSGRRLPVASSTGTEHERDDVQRSIGRDLPSVERRLNERRVTDVGALGAQHTRDVAHLPGDRKIRERHRDLKRLRALVPIVFQPSILHCDKTDGVWILSRHFRSLERERHVRLCYRRSVSSKRKGSDVSKNEILPKLSLSICRVRVNKEFSLPSEKIVQNGGCSP